MIVLHRTIAPPLAPLNNDELMKLRADALEIEDRWVRNLIDRLAGIPDTEH